MINKVILVGNLGADPETRTANSGLTIANLRLATAERIKDRDGNWTDHTEWHRVVVFGKTAENVARFCQKGKQLYVEGRIRTRKWQDKDGNDRWSTEIIGDNVKFLGGRGESSGSSSGGYGGGNTGSGGGSYGGGGGKSGASQSDGWDSGGADDDIPF